MEFVGHVPVLYGARAVGWTSLCTSRTVVIVTVVGYGMVFVPMVRRLVWLLSLLCWHSQVYLALCVPSYTVNYTHAQRVRICRHNIDLVHVNGKIESFL